MKNPFKQARSVGAILGQFKSLADELDKAMDNNEQVAQSMELQAGALRAQANALELTAKGTRLENDRAGNARSMLLSLSGATPPTHPELAPKEKSSAK